MSLLKKYEIEVVNLLTSNYFLPEQIDEILCDSKFVGYEYTGCGYFYSIEHIIFPEERIVCDKPILLGKTVDGIICGFVIFIENNELTLECHSWGEMDIPEDFRERDVQITIANLEPEEINDSQSS